MRRSTVVGLAIAATAAGWGLYFFRPDRAFRDRVVSEPVAVAGTLIRLGTFEPRAHDGSGVSEIRALPDGRRVLVLREFRTLDGPDLKVYLLVNADAASGGDLDAGYVSLGALKGNVGDQSYEIPAEVDLTRYVAVSVWCQRFGVNFTTAPLASPASARPPAADGSAHRTRSAAPTV